MWYCYTIRNEDGFKHLSLFTDDLEEVFDFISKLIEIDDSAYSFVITKNKGEVRW